MFLTAFDIGISTEKQSAWVIMTIRRHINHVVLCIQTRYINFSRMKTMIGQKIEEIKGVQKDSPRNLRASQDTDSYKSQVQHSSSLNPQVQKLDHKFTHATTEFCMTYTSPRAKTFQQLRLQFLSVYTASTSWNKLYSLSLSQSESESAVVSKI